MAKDTKYVSEATKFISTYLQEHPQIIEKQKKLRSTWWDTNGIDQTEQNEYHDSEIKLEGYAYFNYPTQKKPTV